MQPRPRRGATPPGGVDWTTPPTPTTDPRLELVTPVLCAYCLTDCGREAECGAELDQLDPTELTPIELPDGSPAGAAHDVALLARVLDSCGFDLVVTGTAVRAVARPAPGFLGTADALDTPRRVPLPPRTPPGGQTGPVHVWTRPDAPEGAR